MLTTTLQNPKVAPQGGSSAAIIDDIYAVIREPERLAELVARIADWRGADMALLTSPPLPGCRPVPLVLHRMDFTPVMHESELLVRPEFTARALATGNAPGVFRFEDLMGEAERATSDYWQRIMKPLDIISGILCAIRTPDDNNRPVALNLFRKSGSPAFTQADVGAMEELQPHLRRTLSILLDAPPAAPEISALSQAYSAIDTPVFYLDGDAKVVHLNPSAQALVDDGDGLTLSHGDLKLDNTAAQAELDAALSRVIGDNWTTKFRAGAELLAPRPSGARALVLVATPVAANNPIATISARVRCVLFAYEERSDATLGQRIQRLYGLTQSEAEIALAVAMGKSLPEVAEERGTKLVTVRTQLSNIMSKTGARRQANLVSMILRLK